jgi:hypothetical protein
VDDSSRHALAERPEGLGVVKRVLVGKPRPSEEMHETLLSKTLALPIFSADPLSSVAYATEAAMVVLVGVSLAALDLVLPISIAIAAVLAIVVVSYTQTVRAYETSGGAYVVAKENLGTLPSLVAAAALLVDYVLTVAVSVTAGVLAVTSAAPSLESHKVGLSLFFVLLLTLANLRGVRESGIALRAADVRVRRRHVRTDRSGDRQVCGRDLPAGDGAASTRRRSRRRDPADRAARLRVRCVRPDGRGVDLERRERVSRPTWSERRAHARRHGRDRDRALPRRLLSRGLDECSPELERVRPFRGRPGDVPERLLDGVHVLRGAGAHVRVLVLAANASYQGFPRLAAVLARDRFFPRQFVNLGDRLVYSNGIVVLAAISSLLIWAFKADVIALIHLYVIGVFTAFTLSQAGMVRYWLRKESPAWRRSAMINGAGAVATGLVAILVIESKFLEGAWAVTVAIPLLIGGFYAIHRHYRKVGRRLRAGVAAVAAAPPATNHVVLYVESADSALDEALWYVRQIAADDFEAIHVPGRGTDAGILPRFRQLTEMHPDLAVLEREDGRVDAVIEHLWSLPRGESRFVTVVVPELFRSTSLVSALRRPEFKLKLRLLDEPGVVITDVPVLGGEHRPQQPRHAVVRILVSGAHAASLRAVNYATTLGFEDTSAVYFAFDAEEAERMEREWEERRMAVPLRIEEAPFRDLGDPAGSHGRSTASARSTSSARSSSSRA